MRCQLRNGSTVMWLGLYFNIKRNNLWWWKISRIQTRAWFKPTTTSRGIIGFSNLAIWVFDLIKQQEPLISIKQIVQLLTQLRWTYQMGNFTTPRGLGFHSQPLLDTVEKQSMIWKSNQDYFVKMQMTRLGPAFPQVFLLTLTRWLETGSWQQKFLFHYE